MASFRWRIAQYFEKKWWKKYLGNKKPDEYLAWKRNYWLDFLKQISEWITPRQDQSFLDIGCGPAGIFMVLPGTVIAADPLFNAYNSDLPHFNPEKFENVNFFSVRAEDFTSKDKFDVVFSLNVINHVADIKMATQKLYECCKPGGKLILSVDAHNFSLLRAVFKKLHFDILHPYQLTLEEYRKMLINEGFTVVGEKCLRSTFIFNYVVLIAVKN